jgi:hypothetical protein
MPALEEVTTASNRPALWLPNLLLSQVIDDPALSNGYGEEGEPIPAEPIRRAAKDLLAEIPSRLLGNPEISPFYGEIHVCWTRGTKQVVLMCLPDRSSLVHHYVGVPNSAGQHGIEIASGESLLRWLGWLRS